MANTTDDALSLAKSLAFWPDSGPLTDTQLLALLTEECKRRVFPLVLKAAQDYYVQDADYTITADQQLYRLPARAHNGRLSDVLLVDSSSNESSLGQRRQAESRRPQGSAYEFFFKGDWVGLEPTPSTTENTLRLRYYLAPATYVPVASCALVSTVGESRISTASPSSLDAHTSFDLVSVAGLGASVSIGEAATSSGGDLTLGGAVPDQLAVGDYACAAGESCVISLPDQAYSVLVDFLVVRMMQAQKDQAGAKEALSHAQEGVSGLIDQLTDRVDYESEVYVSDV